jgi:hypothetical protein
MAARQDVNMNTPTQPELQISDAIHQVAWQQSQRYSTPRAMWSAYINQVCLDTVLPWLQDDYDVTPTVQFNAGGILNGIALSLNQKRLILIPDKSIDTSELRVPQEWIDVPSLVGDYYLAVQINPDEKSVRVWGYTTHQQLKAKGQYDADDRTYSVNNYQLIQDLQVLRVVQQLCANEPTQAAVSALAEVPQVQAENLLQRLSQIAIDQIRLELPFTLWGALLDSEPWRQRLVQLQNQSVNQTSVVTNLTQWFQNTFTETWRSLETVLNPESPALNFRQAASSELTIQRVKVLSLAEQTVLLIIALTAEPDGRVGIRIQLSPPEGTLCLPQHLNLSLLSSRGNTIQSVQTRSQDNSIQLQRFKCPVGTQFQVQVSYLDGVVTENFQC